MVNGNCESKNLVKLEIYNSVSHLLGVVLGIIFLLMLIIPKIQSNDTVRIVAFSIYGGSFILLFLASSIYHGVLNKKIKPILRLIDYISIYFFIAGSFTPVILLLLEGHFRVIFIILIWLMAILGAIFKIITYNKLDNTKILSLITYISMGWLAIFLIRPILKYSSIGFLISLILGGLLYTIGTYFYKSNKSKYNHLIWHFFVLVAAIVHFNGFYFFF